MIKPGQQLHNGATVVAIERRKVGDEWVILAVQDSFQRFVTWRAGLDDGSDTYSGYYHFNLDDALADFKERCR